MAPHSLYPVLCRLPRKEVCMTSETLYVEIHIAYTKTEQEFLRLAVQAASKKYRELRQSLSQQAPGEGYLIGESVS